METLELYHQAYNGRDKYQVQIYPLSWLLTNADVYPISYNKLNSPITTSPLYIYLAYEQREAYITKDLVWFESIRKELTTYLEIQFNRLQDHLMMKDHTLLYERINFMELSIFSLIQDRFRTRDFSILGKLIYSTTPVKELSKFDLDNFHYTITISFMSIVIDSYLFNKRNFIGILTNNNTYIIARQFEIQTHIVEALRDNLYNMQVLTQNIKTTINEKRNINIYDDMLELSYSHLKELDLTALIKRLDLLTERLINIKESYEFDMNNSYFVELFDKLSSLDNPDKYSELLKVLEVNQEERVLSIASVITNIIKINSEISIIFDTSQYIKSLYDSIIFKDLIEYVPGEKNIYDEDLLIRFNSSISEILKLTSIDSDITPKIVNIFEQYGVTHERNDISLVEAFKLLERSIEKGIHIDKQLLIDISKLFEIYLTEDKILDKPIHQIHLDHDNIRMELYKIRNLQIMQNLIISDSVLRQVFIDDMPEFEKPRDIEIMKDIVEAYFLCRDIEIPNNVLAMGKDKNSNIIKGSLDFNRFREMLTTDENAWAYKTKIVTGLEDMKIVARPTKQSNLHDILLKLHKTNRDMYVYIGTIEVEDIDDFITIYNGSILNDHAYKETVLNEAKVIVEKIKHINIVKTLFIEKKPKLYYKISNIKWADKYKEINKLSRHYELEKPIYKQLRISKEYSLLKQKFIDMLGLDKEMIKQKDLEIIDEIVLSEMYKRWYFMPKGGPIDKLILPNDHPYATSPINGQSYHPFMGQDKATEEIEVDQYIMANVIDFCYELWSANALLYTRYTASQAIMHFTNCLYDWLNKYIPDREYNPPEYDPTEYYDIISMQTDREEYWRLYKWIRWYAEGLYWNVPSETELLGNDQVKKLIEDLVKYFNDHHGVYGTPGNKIFNKTKGVRHKWLKKGQNKLI